MTCSHCEIDHDDDCTTDGKLDHHGLCCECFDLSWFHGLPGCAEQLNAARAAKGRPPITKPWEQRR